MSIPSRAPRSALLTRGLQLEYVSLAWMVVEAGVAVWAGVLAGSIALIAFGLDSVIELFAALVVISELRRGGQTETQQRALRLIGVTFFLLAAYVTVQSVLALLNQSRPEASVPGIVVSAAALVVMPALAVGKRRVGRALSNRVLLADAAETTFCAALSAATLIGLLLNAVVGLWWADPVAGLVIAALAIKEGLEAFEGEEDEDDEAPDGDRS